MSATSAQLKHRIDSGQTGDKVAFPDPAMAPLGTDDEAGGTATSGHTIQKAINAETMQARPRGSLAGFAVIVLSILVVFVCALAAYLI